MKVQPVDHRILVQFHFPDEEEGDIVLPNRNLSPVAEEHRTRVEVLDVGSNVEICQRGDFVLLHEDALRNAVPISKEPATALLHDSTVLAIVLDDAFNL